MTDTAFSALSTTDLPQITLVGISTRTNNAQEANPEQAKIGQTIGRFWQDNLGDKIPHRNSPGRTFAVYTEYESDEHGDYTYFYGQQVDSLTEVPEGLETLTIPASGYQQLTTQAGAIPNIVINAWQSIWEMTPEQLGGQRSYRADFEIYDERATDPKNSVIDIYIGIS